MDSTTLIIVVLIAAGVAAAMFLLPALRRNRERREPPMMDLPATVTGAVVTLREAANKMGEAAENIQRVADTPPPGTPLPPPASALPYTGPYRNIRGEPDPLGQYDERTWKIAAEQARLMDVIYTGPIPASSVSVEEAMFLARVASDWPAKFYTALTNPEAMQLSAVQYAVLSGTRAEVAGVINLANETHAAATVAYDPASYQGRFVPLVEAVMQGSLVARPIPR
jgi:hypothetical protein